MTSKQRVLAAVNHQLADRTPITFDAEGVVYDKLYSHFGHRSRERLFDALHCDTWLIGPKTIGKPQDHLPPEDRTNIWGWKSTTVQYTGGEYSEVSWSPLAEKEQLSDIENHPWPDASVHDFSHFAGTIEGHKDRAIIASSSWGAYFIASFVRGMEGLMMDLAGNQAYAEKLIGTIAERIYDMLDNMLTNHGDGIDIVYMADDYCSQLGPLFDPQLFKRIIVPYLRKMVERTHRSNKKFLLHCCGAVRPLLPMIIDCGVDMLEPIQISATGMEPVGLKRDFGKDLCFYGGMDLQHVLSTATPQQVAKEVRRLIDILGDNGGYVFGPGHTYIQVDAPLENILAMYHEAGEYRRAGSIA